MIRWLSAVYLMMILFWSPSLIAQSAPAVTNQPSGAPPAATAPAPSNPAAQSPAPIPPAHTPQRWAQAINTQAATTPVCGVNQTGPSCLPPYNMPCPVARNGTTPTQNISLYFLSSTADPSRVDKSGPTCFEIRDFNDILYTASFQSVETPPTGSALDYLQDAIKTVTAFNFGSPTTNTTAAAAKNQAPGGPGGGTPAACPSDLTDAITTAQGAATSFATALASISPGKDSSGNTLLIDWRTTTAMWQSVPGTYNRFEAAVSQLISKLTEPNADVCTDTVKATAESVILDAYIPARSTYTVLATHIASDHVVRFTSDLHATSSYSITVQANYPSGTVANGSKTFSLSAGRTILSSSGGFLISEVPSTSYSSVTAPSGMTSPATQNVLAVNGQGSPSLGLTALLNVYLPDIPKLNIPLNGYNWGLALAGGPTYNLSNGKADTSKFGLFAGLSFHIRRQLFLTPGVNIGEYSNWPVGYTAPNQVIPANTGTPTGVTRWTTRFAFTITYKIKDFGQSISTAAPSTPTSGGGSTAPQTNSGKQN